MQRIVAAANTEIPCYLALRALGYEIERVGTDDRETWIATRRERRLESDAGLCTLLGLAQMAELRGDDWPAGDTEIEAFMARYGLGG